MLWHKYVNTIIIYMSNFYDTVLEMNAKYTPFPNRSSGDASRTPISQTTFGQKTQPLVFYGQDDDYFLAAPKSIMNEHVGVNYRTIYNGFAMPSKTIGGAFTLYDDYARCMETKNAYVEYMRDKRNPTYANILKYYNDEKFDPNGIARYKMQDFIYLKYYNQIPNNHMITLRRYATPIDDHIVGLDYNASTRIALNQMPKDSFAIATAVTYMGEQTGNKLSDILKFEYGANWEKKSANVNLLQNSDGGLAAQMKERMKLNENTIAGVNPEIDMRGSAIMSLVSAARGTSPITMQSMSKAFDQDEFISTYGEEFFGDINSITETDVRARGLTFSNSFTLNFEYSLKSLKCVNPKVAMMDILSNFLLLTGNYGSFWGGATIYYGARALGPQFGNPQLLREGKYGQYLNSLAEDMKTSFENFKALGTDANGEVTFSSVLSGLGSLLKGGLQSLLGNLLGGNIGVAGTTQAPRALLSGAPTGFWHVVIGNPLDPIAMMGNMKIEKTSVQFNDVLGYDDFPTEIKFTVELSHAKPRDNGGIETMFNGNKGRFYVLSREFESKIDLPDNYTAGQIKPSGTQEATGMAHTGSSASGPFTNGKLAIIGSLIS